MCANVGIIIRLPSKKGNVSWTAEGLGLMPGVYVLENTSDWLE